jgi:hypothetical protein
MRRTSLIAIGSMFTLALCFGSSVMHAERRGDDQQGQQGQGQQGRAQGQAQQGQGQQGAAKPPADNISLRKFVFTLALGDVQAGAGSNFTPAAAKALADLKDFLPYKRYTLLDTIYKIGLSGPGASMKGVDDGQKYDLYTTGVPSSVPNRASMRLQLKGASGFVIETTFEIELGETVVVGTSRLDGNRALLLLVTSVP